MFILEKNLKKILQSLKANSNQTWNKLFLYEGNSNLFNEGQILSKGEVITKVKKLGGVI
jgi:RNA polymerase-interacting CarD/CdnL/TRCF family regulator